MTTTPNLELVEVDESESIAYKKFNESYRALDVIVQLSVKSAALTTPPPDPEQGDRYIVPSTGATGAWASYPRRVAFYTLDGWQFRTPRYGWRAEVEDAQQALIYRGLEWEPDAGGAGGGAGNFIGGRSVEGAFLINLSIGSAQEITLLDDAELSITGVTAGSDVRAILIIRQDIIGGRKLTWPAGTVWPGGAEPEVSRNPHTVHIYELVTFDGGPTLYARLIGGSFYNESGPPPPYPTDQDAFWPYVSYLFHMDGNDGESVFDEEKGHAVEVVSGGDYIPITTTASKKFGTASVQFSSPNLPPFDRYDDPDALNYLRYEAAPENDLSSEDFTLECWVRDRGGVAATANTHTIVMKPGTSYTDVGMFLYSYLGLLTLNYFSGDDFSASLNVPVAAPNEGKITTTEFRHVFLSRKDGVFYFGVNGYSWTDGVQRPNVDLSTQPFCIGGGEMIGGHNGDCFYANLEIDDFRFTLGQCRISGTPPAVPSPSVEVFAGNYPVPTVAFSAPDTVYEPDVKKRIRQVGATWVRSGAAIATPVDDVVVRIQNRGRIVRLNILGIGGPGDCVVDIRKDSIATYPSMSLNSIFTGSVLPEISSGHKLTMEAEGDWSRDLQIDDVLIFSLDDAANFRSIEVTLDIEDVQ